MARVRSHHPSKPWRIEHSTEPRIEMRGAQPAKSRAHGSQADSQPRASVLLDRQTSPARAGIALPKEGRYVGSPPGRLKDYRRFRLASGRQLWRLNELGRLRVVD